MSLKLRHHPTKRAPKKLADNNLFSKRNNNNYYSLQYQLSCFLKPAELPWWKNIPFSCHRKTQCQTWGLRLMQISQKAYFQCRPPLMHICEFCCLLKERFFELTGTKCPETVGSTSIIWNLFVFQIMRNKPFLPMLICKFSLKRLFIFFWRQYYKKRLLLLLRQTPNCNWKPGRCSSVHTWWFTSTTCTKTECEK